jgi:predicted nuclease of predicted toxin-antitoxin system
MPPKIDENLPVEVAALLVSRGHEADTVADEQLSGAPDPDLASLCRREKRTLVTLDRGFADIRSYPPGEHDGIVVLRLDRQDKAAVLRLCGRLAEHLGTQPLIGHLWIVETGRIRIRGATP